ncbi:hypothetical protein NEOKW01_1782 [Nematocida sp. AWRm80]|nr:hypothetical protein NEOKW01_1782 [Nematocida sp. AWRm80]
MNTKRILLILTLSISESSCFWDWLCRSGTYWTGEDQDNIDKLNLTAATDSLNLQGLEAEDTLKSIGVNMIYIQRRPLKTTLFIAGIILFAIVISIIIALIISSVLFLDISKEECLKEEIEHINNCKIEKIPISPDLFKIPADDTFPTCFYRKGFALEPLERVNKRLKRDMFELVKYLLENKDNPQCKHILMRITSTDYTKPLTTNTPQ